MSLNPTTAQVNDPTLTIKSGTVQGGDGGDSFDDFTSTCRVVTEIQVWAGRYIDAIQIVYSDAPAPKRGGNGGNDHTFTVEADDQIVRIDGRGGRYIDQLQFFTKKGRESSVFGGSGGNPFSWDAPEGYHFRYFTGKSGEYIDSLQPFFDNQ